MAEAKSPALAVLIKRLSLIIAEDIMTKDVISTTVDTPLADISELVIRKRISGLPVVNGDGQPVGVITATDLFAMMYKIESGETMEEDLSINPNPTVKVAMSKEILKIVKDTNLYEIINIMKSKNIHTLPVFEDDVMIGVVGRRDVVKTFYAVVKSL